MSALPEAASIKGWIDLLRPIDPEEVAVLDELTRDSTVQDSWKLLVEEAGQLLRRRNRPASAAVVCAALHRLGGVAEDHLLLTWERTCVDAFRPPPLGAEIDDQWLRQTHRAAVALHGLFVQMATPETEADDRFAFLLGGLELLARADDRRAGLGQALSRLLPQLQRDYPYLATEISGFVAGAAAALRPPIVDDEQRQAWTVQLAALSSEIRAGVVLHATRGLALLSRIQSDNNRRVFRPILDAIESADCLSPELTSTIRGLSARELIDRHPLQLAAGGGRKIEGAARKDAIQHYEVLIRNAQEALDVRLKIEGAGRTDAGTNEELNHDLSRFIADWRARGTDATGWLLVRLLSSDVLLVRSRLPIPDASVLGRAEGAQMGPVSLFAIIEPTTLAAIPRAVAALDGLPASAANLMMAIAAQPETLAADRMHAEQMTLAREGRFLVGRLWAAVTEQLFAGEIDLRRPLEAELAQQRAILLNEIGAVQGVLAKSAVAGERTMIERLRQAHSLAGLGFLSDARRVFETLCQEQALDPRKQVMPAHTGMPVAEPRRGDLLQDETMSAQLIRRERAGREPMSSAATLAEPASPASSLCSVAIASLSEESEQHDIVLQRRFEQAEDCRTRNRLSEAQDILRRLLGDAPRHVRARSQLVLVLDKLGCRDDAIAVLEAGLEIAPKYVPFLHQIVPLLARQGRLPEARRFASRGLEVCRNPGEEIGFLNDLVHIERQSGNREAVVGFLRRLVRVAPHTEHYRNLLDQASGSSPSMPEVVQRAAIEPLPWELPPEGLDISPFLAADLQEPHSLVAADFVERKGPEKAVDEAMRLWDKAVRNPDTARPGADAEALRTGAKLIMEVHELCPDVDYLAYVAERHRRGERVPAASDHESALRRWVSLYAARKGDDFFLKQRTEPARAYYLEHFRVSARLSTFSLYSADKYIRTSVPEAGETVTIGKTYLAERYRARERPRHAPEAVVVMFAATLERNLLASPSRDPRVSQFLLDFLDVCLCNGAARAALLSLTGDPGHMVSKVLWDVAERAVLHSHATTARDWVERGLQLRQEHHRLNCHDLDFVVNELLPKRQYPQSVDLLSQVRARGCSAADQRIIGRAEELFRLAERFERSKSFDDKKYLASEASLRVRETQDSIVNEPTTLGRVHLAPMVFRLDRDLDAAFQQFKERSPAVIAVRAVKSVRTTTGIRADIHVENQGRSPAEQVTILLQTGQDGEVVGELDLPRLQSGPANAVVQKVDLRLAAPAAPPDADVIELAVHSRWTDAEGTLQQMAKGSVRLSISVHRTYVWVENPYLTGPIVMNERLFKGRDQLVLDVLQEVANRSSAGSVVIWGQKRSGKSSILHWVAMRAPDWAIPVRLFVPEMLADEAGLAKFFFLASLKIVEEARNLRKVEIPPIDEDALFESRVPSHVFRQYLEGMGAALGSGRRLLLLFDEFTDLTALIERGHFDRGFLRYLKGLIEHGLFSSVICGGDLMPRVLKRFSNDFAVASPRMVTYLDEPSVRQLVEDPTRLPDGTSRFGEGAIARIQHLTAGAPYYVQLLCSRLVDHLNREQNPDPRVTTADVEETVRGMIDGRAKVSPWTAFDSLCRYKEDPGNDTYPAVLEGLALHVVADGTRFAEFVGHDAIVDRMSQFAPRDEIEYVLNDLLDRETLMVPRGSPVRQYRIRVGLFCEWLLANRPLDPQAFAGFAQRLDTARKKEGAATVGMGVHELPASS